ncbi:MAG: (2Fe-2S)-binding protein [Candidatus Izemoplasmatales bacterium]|jgi:aerobic-type carbon monoxide dehydrogenase small subunit (CoxS/CutS family)|nr:(2Fe-2S)-binding protein [Candidatus Izemoplasmatales bacterium]
MRVEKHPILEFPMKAEIPFYYNGELIKGFEGDTIASALHALGIKVLSKSIHHKRARGFYCAIGNCGSCNMTVNHVPNVRTCMTKLEPGMIVESQEGLGILK